MHCRDAAILVHKKSIQRETNSCVNSGGTKISVLRWHPHKAGMLALGTGAGTTVVLRLDGSKVCVKHMPSRVLCVRYVCGLCACMSLASICQLSEQFHPAAVLTLPCTVSGTFASGFQQGRRGMRSR